MVLRRSPWESRTPPATKGHFARGRPLRMRWEGGLPAYVRVLFYFASLLYEINTMM